MGCCAPTPDTRIPTPVIAAPARGYATFSGDRHTRIPTPVIAPSPRNRPAIPPGAA